MPLAYVRCILHTTIHSRDHPTKLKSVVVEPRTKGIYSSSPANTPFQRHWTPSSDHVRILPDRPTKNSTKTKRHFPALERPEITDKKEKKETLIAHRFSKNLFRDRDVESATDGSELCDFRFRDVVIFSVRFDLSCISDVRRRNVSQWNARPSRNTEKTEKTFLRLPALCEARTCLNRPLTFQQLVNSK